MLLDLHLIFHVMFSDLIQTEFGHLYMKKMTKHMKYGKNIFRKKDLLDLENQKTFGLWEIPDLAVHVLNFSTIEEKNIQKQLHQKTIRQAKDILSFGIWFSCSSIR